MEWLSVKEAEQGSSERAKDPSGVYLRQISSLVARGRRGQRSRVGRWPVLEICPLSREEESAESSSDPSADFNFVARWRSPFLC